VKFNSRCDDCRFERDTHKDQGADIFSSRPVFSAVTSCSRDGVCLRSIMSWLERVLTAVDCYSWTFSQNLLTPAQLLTGWLMAHHTTWKFCAFSFCDEHIFFLKTFILNTVFLLTLNVVVDRLKRSDFNTDTACVVLCW